MKQICALHSHNTCLRFRFNLQNKVRNTAWLDLYSAPVSSCSTASFKRKTVAVSPEVFGRWTVIAEGGFSPTVEQSTYFVLLRFHLYLKMRHYLKYFRCGLGAWAYGTLALHAALVYGAICVSTTRRQKLNCGQCYLTSYVVVTSCWLG